MSKKIDKKQPLTDLSKIVLDEYEARAVKFSIPITEFMEYQQIDISVWKTTKYLNEANPDDAPCLGVTKSYSVETIISSDTDEDNDNSLYVEIHLSKESLGGGVVSHEATHAALRLFEHNTGTNKYEIDHDREERIAYLVGDIVSKIYTELYARNIIEELTQ